MTLLKDLIQREAITCGPDCPVEELVHLMRTHEISGVPVVDSSGDLLGVVSASDLLRKQSGVKARELMTSKFFHLSDHSTVRQAAQLMAQERVHRIVVTSEQRHVTGVLTALDLVQFLSRLPVATLSTY